MHASRIGHEAFSFITLHHRSRHPGRQNLEMKGPMAFKRNNGQKRIMTAKLPEGLENGVRVLFGTAAGSRKKVL
jgi:hypothetical protein